MTLPTFTPPCAPSPGLTDTPEVKILKSEFGDGYTQASPQGLNHIRKVVEATWDVLDRAERDYIIDFFMERAGYQPFWFQMPHDAAATKWIVESWSDTVISGGFHRVTATFRQSFSLAV
ncbi:MAG: phage tail protein [Aurantimonas coralicida]